MAPVTGRVDADQDFYNSRAVTREKRKSPRTGMGALHVLRACGNPGLFFAQVTISWGKSVATLSKVGFLTVIFASESRGLATTGRKHHPLICSSCVLDRDALRAPRMVIGVRAHSRRND